MTEYQIPFKYSDLIKLSGQSGVIKADLVRDFAPKLSFVTLRLLLLTLPNQICKNLMFYALDGSRKLPVIFWQVIPEMVLTIDV